MYWAGRYLERVEATCRLVQSHTSLLLDLPAESNSGWNQLLKILNVEDDFNTRYATATESNIVRFLLSDQQHRGSVQSSLEGLRENIRTTRDIVPREGWECVNELYLAASRKIDRAPKLPRLRQALLSECIAKCQHLSGLLSGTMSHGDGYHFLKIGSYLERADMTSRVLDVAATTLTGAPDGEHRYADSLWIAVLKSVSAYQMYRQNVRRRVIESDVVRFLLADESFPRTIQWSLTQLDSALRTLPNNAAALNSSSTLQLTLNSAKDAQLSATAVHESVDELQRGLGRLHYSIEETWFLKPSPSGNHHN